MNNNWYHCTNTVPIAPTYGYCKVILGHISYHFPLPHTIPLVILWLIAECNLLISYHLNVHHMYYMAIKLCKIAMYERGLAYIKHNGQLATPLACHAGVRQGDTLSPNLSNIFLKDLPLKLHADADSPRLDGQTIKCFLYADDLVLFATSNDVVQKHLDRLL